MTIVRVRFTPNGVPTPGEIQFQLRPDTDQRPLTVGRDVLNGNAVWEPVPVEGAEIDVPASVAGFHYVLRFKPHGHTQSNGTFLVPPNGPIDIGDLVSYDPKAGMAYEPDPDWWAHLVGVEVGFDAVQADVHTARDQAQSAATSAAGEVSAALTAAVASDADRAVLSANQAGTIKGDLEQIFLGGTEAVNDAAVKTFVDDGQTRGAISNLIDTRAIDAPLDIWEEFRTGVTFNDATYPGWIAGIDAALTGKATKTTIGTASDGSTPIYAYRAGKVGAPQALIVSGVHAHEINSEHASFRWFESFAKGSDSVMRELAQRCEVTWIPTLNPSPAAFRSTRFNANGVDLNRNQPFFWKLFNSTQADIDSGRGSKGDSPGSEPESVALRNLLNARNFTFVLDCHMWGNDGANIQFFPLSGWSPGNRGIATAARDKWDRSYGEGGTYTSSLTGASNLPTVTNFSGCHMWRDRGRKSASSILIEARSGVAGSTSTRSSRPFMRTYCGAIQASMLAWLTGGQEATIAPVDRYAAWRTQDSSLPTTPLSQGGNLLAPFAEQSFHTFINGFEAKNQYIDFPLKAPSEITVLVTALLQSESTATVSREIRHICGLSLATSPDTSPTSRGQSLTHVQVPPGGGQAMLSQTFTIRTQEPNETWLWRLAPKFQLNSSGSSVIVRNVRVDITVTPIGPDGGGGHAVVWTAP